MKKMIQNRFCVLLLLGTVFLGSCSEWLEENPETSYDINDLEGEAAIQSLLVGTYASMRDTYNLNSTIGIVGTDICRAGKVNVNTVNLDLYTLNSSLTVVENAWINSYSAIQCCNIVINRAQHDATLDANVRKRFIAQARFMRAFSYFKMVQWFGALPLVTDETAAYDEWILTMPRSDVRDVYDLIVSDLLYAGTRVFWMISRRMLRLRDMRPGHCWARSILRWEPRRPGSIIIRNWPRTRCLPNIWIFPNLRRSITGWLITRCWT